MSETDLNKLLSARSLPAIVIHGGAWTRDESVHPAVLAGVVEAARVGFQVLQSGGSALDAVEAAVVVLEENPNFNAGYGSCLTSDGTVEMDAAIMTGETLDAGAVASVVGIRNPVKLARRVMLNSGHVLLAAEGAMRFAREQGIPLMAPDWAITPVQRERYLQLKREADELAPIDRRKLGTVGAVAVDKHGHVAAATSTGGTPFKRPGRVGDSPLIGAGNYADDASAAVSCTGHGESIIKLGLALSTCHAVALGAAPIDAAVAATQRLRERVNGDGGLIIVAPDGRCGWSTNTPRMSRALMRAGMDSPVAMV